MPPEQLSEGEGRQLGRVGAKLGRNRHQSGRVEEVKTKAGTKWRGHYYVYRFNEDGAEKRQHRITDLGEKGKITKSQAKELLRVIIAKHTGDGKTKPTDEITVEQFYESNYLPLVQENWKASSSRETEANIRRYVIKPLGNFRLNQLTKVLLQKHLNKLAADDYSKSVIDKAFDHIKGICDEAVDQYFLDRDPARRLRKPPTKEPNRELVAIERLQEGFSKLSLREQTMLRLALVIGLRPNEILALHWNDVTPQGLRIDEGAVDGKLYEPKTKASKKTILLPGSLQSALSLYRASVPHHTDDDLLFPSPRGLVARLDNYRKRVFNPAMEKAGLKGITFQMCRRSCSTWMVNGKHGSLKDAQAVLRHTQASTTLGIYVQEHAESMQKAIDSLDRKLFGSPQEVKSRKKKK